MKKILSVAALAIMLVSCSKKNDLSGNTPAAAVSAPLSAGFSIDNQEGVTEGITAQFRNLSVSAVSYQWDFGGGDVSTQKDPVYAFPGCGHHSAILTAKDAKGNTQSFVIELEVLCSGKHAPHP